MRKTLLTALLCVVAGCQAKNQSGASDRDSLGQDPNSINTPAGKPPPEAPGPPVPEAQPRRALTR